MDNLRNWREWDRKWQRTITDQSGFEWNFAKDVIQKVPGLDPNNVIPQRSFIGNDGRELHMDFAIELDDIKIAIEVEGWDKTGEQRGKNKQEHDEFNRRVQSLESQGWRILTITNAQFSKDPAQYSNLIRQLILQGSKTSDSESVNGNVPGEEVQAGRQGLTTEPDPKRSRSKRQRYILAFFAAITVFFVAIWLGVRDSGSEDLEFRDQVQELDQDSQKSEDLPIPSESERSPQRYLTKDGTGIDSYEDDSGDVDCKDFDGYPEAVPVLVLVPGDDPYGLDGDSDGWACGTPTYFYSGDSYEDRTDWFWDYQAYETESRDVNCKDIPVEYKPVNLTNPKEDPYKLDGLGEEVGDGVACS